MILYKCHFGPLWITTLILSYYFLVVGGQTLGSLAGNKCFRGCFATKCPGLETDCVCSEFRMTLDMAGILACTWGICPVEEAMAGFMVFNVGCSPFISSATGRNRRNRSTTTISLPSSAPTTLNPSTTSTTAANSVIRTPTSTRPPSTVGLPSSPTSLSPRTSSPNRPCSTSPSSTSLSSSTLRPMPPCLTSSSLTSSRCTTPSSTVSSIPVSPISTFLTTTTLSAGTQNPPAGGPPSPSNPLPLERDVPTKPGIIVAAVLVPIGFLSFLLAIFLILRRRQGRNRRSIISFTGINNFDANRGSVTAPLPAINSVQPRVPLADVGTRPPTQGSQMSAGVGAEAMAAVAVTRGASARGEYIGVATPMPGPSQSNNQLRIFPPTSRRPPVTQPRPQSQQNPALLRSLKKPLPQLPRFPEEARIIPRAGPSTRSSSLALLPTVYPIADNPRPMSAISELAEVDRYQPIPDDATEVEFRRVYHDVRRALNRSPSTSTDQNSTDWSIMTDLSRNSTTRSFIPER